VAVPETSAYEVALELRGVEVGRGEGRGEGRM